MQNQCETLLVHLIKNWLYMSIRAGSMSIIVWHKSIEYKVGPDRSTSCWSRTVCQTGVLSILVCFSRRNIYRKI